MPVLTSALSFLLVVATLNGIVCPWQCMQGARYNQDPASLVVSCHTLPYDPSHPSPGADSCQNGCQEKTILAPATGKFELPMQLIALDLAFVPDVSRDLIKPAIGLVGMAHSPPSSRSLILRIQYFTAGTIRASNNRPAFFSLTHFVSEPTAGHAGAVHPYVDKRSYRCRSQE